MHKSTTRRLPLILLLLGTSPATAQSINEDRKITASDNAAGDVFGSSVAISGHTIVVGAPRNTDVGTDTGSAYVFDATTGQQLFKLMPSDVAAFDQFGNDVAISGTTAVVGMLLDDDAGTNSGSAYIFDTTTGQELFKLLASDAAAGDLFGYSVGICGTTAIVGAPEDGDAGPKSGSAYLFDTITGQQMFKLTASDAAAQDWFGRRVAISGNIAIVGAVYDSDAGQHSGSAYLFDTTTGQQLLKLTASDAAESDNFGISVAIFGTTAIVGASSDDDAGSNSGSAYIFDTITGQQLFKLIASDAAPFDFFGSSVAISGTTAIVGMPGDDNAGGFRSGSAYMFDTTTGQQLLKLTASDPGGDDSFALRVAISGTTTVVGAHQHSGAGFRSGSAYIFTVELCTADWNSDGLVNFFDIVAFVADFSDQSPAADLAAPLGVFNFFDMAAYIQLYNTGCP